MTSNPYLDEYWAIYRHEIEQGRTLAELDGAPSGFCTCEECFQTDEEVKYLKTSRRELIKRYSFAIPNDEALDAIANLGKSVMEFGAGTGYWAHLLEEKGVEVLAFDFAPPGHEEWNNPFNFTKTFTEVYPASGPELLESIQFTHDFALMLCWPDYEDTFALDTLKAYKGEILIYIGEGPGGCTADDGYFEELESKWTLVRYVEIPQWAGIHDQLEIYHRAVEE